MINTVSRITAEQVDHATASGRTPVVFIHGLWLLPSRAADAGVAG